MPKKPRNRFLMNLRPRLTQWIIACSLAPWVSASAQSSEYIAERAACTAQVGRPAPRGSSMTAGGASIATAMQRVKDLRAQQPNLPITWMVYRDSYLRRSAADGKPYTAWIQEKQAEYNIRVVWFRTGDEVIGATSTVDRTGHAPRSTASSLSGQQQVSLPCSTTARTSTACRRPGCTRTT